MCKRVRNMQNHQYIHMQESRKDLIREVAIEIIDLHRTPSTILAQTEASKTVNTTRAV